MESLIYRQKWQLDYQQYWEVLLKVGYVHKRITIYGKREKRLIRISLVVLSLTQLRSPYEASHNTGKNSMV